MLQGEKIVDETWVEDKITRELCVRIQVHIQENGINSIPVHQYPIFPKIPKRGRAPTIDFVFRRGYEESSYLSFECKILNCHDSSSVAAYIDEGIMRFISGKYASNEKIGGMVGYLINEKIDNCVEKINEKVEQKISKFDCLVKSSVSMDFDGIYESNHSRVHLNAILIYHIFMIFKR